MAHSGSGGMTSSLSVGIHGSANVRRLLQFPLSPILVTGRSDISKVTQKLEDPRYHNRPLTTQDLKNIASEQWASRSRPVNDRAWVEAQLKIMK